MTSSKKAKIQYHFQSKWIKEYLGIGKSSKGNNTMTRYKGNNIIMKTIGNLYARCTFCSSDFSVGIGDVAHLKPRNIKMQGRQTKQPVLRTYLPL